MCGSGSDDFLDSSEAVIFFNWSDERAVFLLPQGSPLVPILEETYLAEFYLTDREGNFVLCYNHHSYLIAVGTARDWVRERIALRE